MLELPIEILTEVAMSLEWKDVLNLRQVRSVFWQEFITIHSLNY